MRKHREVYTLLNLAEWKLRLWTECDTGLTNETGLQVQVCRRRMPHVGSEVATVEFITATDAGRISMQAEGCMTHHDRNVTKSPAKVQQKW